MFVSALPHRLTFTLFALVLLVPFSASAFEENRCLDEAVKYRTEDLEDAYSAYNDLLERLLDRFDSVERNAYRETENRYYRNGEVYRGQYAYSSQIQEANRNLNVRIQQIWNDYAAKIRLCTGSEYSYDFRSNRVSSDPYDYFDLPYRSSTRSYTSYYGSYPSQYYNQYRTKHNYKYYNYSPYYNNQQYYNNSYNYGSYYNQCSPPVLDPHCGYVCNVGSNGCYSCRQQFCY